MLRPAFDGNSMNFRRSHFEIYQLDHIAQYAPIFMGCGRQFLIDTMQVARCARDLSSTNSTMKRKSMPDTRIRSLEEQRAEFSQRLFLAMPLAGTLAWLLVGVGGVTGSIVYLGMFLSCFTGEHFLDRSRPKNAFDGLFFSTLVMALLVYAIAIPFFLQDYTLLPLTVGVLTGLMWLPLSWIIQHWVGTFHAVARTVPLVQHGQSTRSAASSSFGLAI